GTHVSPREREAFFRLCEWGLVDVYRRHHPEPGRYSWWDYRAGDFHRNFGMRIDHLLATRPIAERTVWAEIDRGARKGKPTPSDLSWPQVPRESSVPGGSARATVNERPSRR